MVTRKHREFEKAQIRLTDLPSSDKIKEQIAVVCDSNGTKHFSHKVGTIDVNDQSANDKFVSRFEDFDFTCATSGKNIILR